MTTPDVLEAAKPWMQQCGIHDFGIQAGSCGCPPDGDPRLIVSKLAGELEAARKALLAVADVFGYELTDEEKAEQVREGWQGVPERIAEDLSELRGEIERLREDAAIGHRCTSRLAEESGAVLRCFLYRGHNVPLSSIGGGLHLAGGVHWADDDDRVVIEDGGERR